MKICAADLSIWEGGVKGRGERHKKGEQQSGDHHRWYWTVDGEQGLFKPRYSLSF